MAVLMLAGRPGAEAGWPLPVATVCLVWAAVFVSCMWRAIGTPYLFTTAYILVLGIFHFGVIIPLAFGWEAGDGWRTGDLARWIKEGAWYTALALGCFGMGAALSLRASTGESLTENAAASTARRAHWAGVGLFVASLVFFLMFVRATGNPLDYSRADFFHSTVAGRGLGAFLFVFPASIVLMAVCAQTTMQKKFAWILAAIGLFVLLVSGYRNQAFSPLLAGVVLWVKTGRRIPPIVATIGVLVVVLLISAISYLRAAGTYGSLQREDVETALDEAAIDRTFAELGGTAAVLAEIVRIVQTEDDYRWGRTYWRALVNAIPNVSSTMQESSRRAAVNRNLTARDALEQLSPSEWLTYRIARDKFDLGEGVGFSAIGEPLLNFGPFGVVAFFAMLGYLLGRLDQIELLAHPRLLIASGALFWALLRTARNDMGILVKTAVFVAVVLAIWRLCSTVIPFAPRRAR